MPGDLKDKVDPYLRPLYDALFDMFGAEKFEKHLYTGELGVKDPDLIIRTSGEIRISNFLLWQLAYSEMIFVDVLWPDFTPDIFKKTIMEYQRRSRRFGGR